MWARLKCFFMGDAELMLAIQENSLERIEEYLVAGTKITEGHFAAAIIEAGVPTVKKLLDRGMSVDQVFDVNYYVTLGGYKMNYFCGHTPLTVGVHAQRIDTIKELVRYGARINLPVEYVVYPSGQEDLVINVTALDVANILGLHDIAQALIELGGTQMLSPDITELKLQRCTKRSPCKPFNMDDSKFQSFSGNDEESVSSEKFNHSLTPNLNEQSNKSLISGPSSPILFTSKTETKPVETEDLFVNHVDLRRRTPTQRGFDS